MKERLSIETLRNGLIKPRVQTKGWTLCIGAGTSAPVFPTWPELTQDIIQDMYPSVTKQALQKIVSQYNLDALIQAAYNIRNVSSEEFAEYLSSKLYKKLQQEISIDKWDRFCKIFTSTHSNAFEDTYWEEFIQTREELFKQTTAYALAKFIVEDCTQDNRPNAILSFNAEPLLYALINSFLRERVLGQEYKESEVLDLMTTSIASHDKHKIPYYFCHGSLLSYVARSGDKRLHAASKLVFLENQYLQMSNSTFSWQSSTFLSQCTNSVLIFVGVSLSDPNMRKWLSWVQTERNVDINETVNSTQHFWINKKPQDETIMTWMEAAVYHLGVRIIWINEWSEVTSVLKKIIIGIEEPIDTKKQTVKKKTHDFQKDRKRNYKSHRQVRRKREFNG